MVFCLATLFGDLRRARSERKKRRQQSLRDPLLFCLDLMIRLGMDEEKAVARAAANFSATKVDRARRIILGLLKIQDDDDYVDVSECSSSIEEAPSISEDDLKLARLRQVTWAMRKAEEDPSFVHLSYSATSGDVQRYIISTVF